MTLPQFRPPHEGDHAAPGGASSPHPHGAVAPSGPAIVPEPGPIRGAGSVPGPSAPAAADAPGIQVDGVHRAFGSVQAVAGMSLTAHRGRVTALVGPNGCGKSTLMLMLASLLAPDTGTVRICGYDPLTHPAEVRRLVGWMPDQFGTWDSLKVHEVLSIVGRAYFMPSADIRQRIPELLAEVDLESLANQPARVLSRGQKQRLGLARALMHRPQVLILDEPASGLDPASRRNLQRIVRSFAAGGGTVLVSSHILTELEEMADDVAVMDQGALVDQSSVRDLAHRPRPWRLESASTTCLHDALAAVGLQDVAVIPPDQAVSGHAEAIVMARDEEAAARLLADLVRADAALVAFAPSAGRLESAYLSTEAAQRKGAL